jgi:CHASE3 domain sensor protein
MTMRIHLPRFKAAAPRAGHWRPSVGISSKLTFGFGILVALTFLSAGISYVGSQQATAGIERTNDVRMPAALVASQAQANLLSMQSDVRGYLALGDRAYAQSYADSRAAFEANLVALYDLSPNLDAANNQRVAKLRTAYEQWTALPARLFELRDDQMKREPAYRLLATDGVRYAGKVLIATSSLIDAGDQAAASAEALGELQDQAKFQGNFAAMLSALRGYVTTRNRIFYQEYEVNLAANQISWEQLSAQRARLAVNEQKLLDEVEQNRNSFLGLVPQILETLEGDQWREDLYLFRTQAMPLADQMQQLLKDMTADQQALLQTDLGQGRAALDLSTQRTLGSGLVALVAGLVLALFIGASIVGPVRRLTGVAEQITAGDLGAQARVESSDEVGTLALAFNHMTGQLRQMLVQVRREKQRADNLLNVVIPLGVQLSWEKHFERLLETIVIQAQTFCHASAGLLDLRTADDHLQFVIIRNDAQGVALGGTSGQAIPYPPLPLWSSSDTGGRPRSVGAEIARSGRAVNIPDLSSAAAYDRDFTGRGDICPGYDIVSLLGIPLKNNRDEVLGVLYLLNAQDPETGQITAFDFNLQQMMESFSLLAVAALEAYIRERDLQREIQQLRIEIDEAKSQKQVSEIVETDFFRDLQTRARAIRSRAHSTAMLPADTTHLDTSDG